MKNVKCSTQAELDEALKNPEVWPELVGGYFEISGSATVRASGSATVTASGSATVTAFGSATVRASGSATVTAFDSATVTASGSATVTAFDSATVTASDSATVRASDSATVTASGSATVTAFDSATVTAFGSATVRASDSATVTAFGSATVTASGSATVTASGSATVTAFDSATVRASGSATVTAFGSATVTASGSATVRASKYVAITKTGGRVKATGGVQIDYQSPQSLAEWFEEYGVVPADGIAILYKAVGSDFKSEHGGDYTPGTTPKSDLWNTTQECGSGLHFCGTPHHALGFYKVAKRFVACPVAVDSIAFTANGYYPTKVKAPCVVAPGCYEVGINGRKL
jgi:hypothetical protein